MTASRRDQLRLDLLDPFEAWATRNGYVREISRYPGDVLRLAPATDGRPILFRLIGIEPDCLTTSKKGEAVFRDFLREIRLRG